jgi:hypothetical protein
MLQDRIVMLELEIQQLTHLLKGSIGGGAKGEFRQESYTFYIGLITLVSFALRGTK